MEEDKIRQWLGKYIAEHIELKRLDGSPDNLYQKGESIEEHCDYYSVEVPFLSSTSLIDEKTLYLRINKRTGDKSLIWGM